MFANDSTRWVIDRLGESSLRSRLCGDKSRNAHPASPVADRRGRVDDRTLRQSSAPLLLGPEPSTRDSAVLRCVTPRRQGADVAKALKAAR